MHHFVTSSAAERTQDGCWYKASFWWVSVPEWEQQMSGKRVLSSTLERSDLWLPPAASCNDCFWWLTYWNLSVAAHVFSCKQSAKSYCYCCGKSEVSSMTYALPVTHSPHSQIAVARWQYVTENVVIYHWQCGTMSLLRLSATGE